jgi:hypothetical protein
VAAAHAPNVASNPLATMHHVFHSTAFLLFRNLTLFFVAVFWLSLGYWVYKDARRRIDDPWLVGAATVLGLFPPFVGPLVYLLFRPGEYLAEERMRALELQEIEATLDRRLRCPVCRASSEPDFLACPVCKTKLRQACTGCGAPVEAIWQMCPWCENPVDEPAVVGLDGTGKAPAALDDLLKQQAGSIGSPARRRAADRPAQA